MISHYPGFSVKTGSFFKLLSPPSYEKGRPPARVASTNYVTPGHAECMVDGHWVITTDSDPYSLGRIRPVVAADISGPARKSLAVVKQVHFSPGDGDTQYGTVPVLNELDYFFLSADVDLDSLEGFAVGVRCNLKWDATKSRPVLTPASAGEEFVAVVEGKQAADGFFKFRRAYGTSAA